MAATDVDIASNALVKLGAKAISSFDDGSTEAVIANALYSAAIDDLLAKYEWRHAQNIKSLDQIADTPAAKFDYAYQLPSDLVKLHGCFRDDLAIRYDLFGDQVWTNEDDNVFAEYTFRPAVDTWPIHFVTVAEFYLAFQFAMPVTQIKAVRDEWKDDYYRELMDAKRQDGRQRTTHRARANRLMNAHGG
jgi:hypothetical protein